MHSEDEQLPGSAAPRAQRKPSFGFIVLALAAAAAIIASSFALAHALIGEAFRRLTN